jgi:hypothetical protein
MSDDRKDRDERIELPVMGTAIDRRHALKIMAIAAATPGAVAGCAPGEEATDPTALPPAPASNPKAAGTAWDPDLLAGVAPWDRTLSPDELESLAALCDVILPADARSPAASALGCHDFIDEWISAPYDGNQADGVLVRGGLVWLDNEAAGRFGDGVAADGGADPSGVRAGPRFRDLTLEQKHAICDDICFRPDAAPEHVAAARFFDKVRDLTSTAFWTTQEGMDDLGYVGNTPLPSWGPPPPEVLRHLGLEG